MVLSKREKYIGLATVAAVVLLIGNSLILNPLLDELRDLDLKIDQATAQQSTNQDLLDRAMKASKDWGRMLTPKGSLLSDESPATSQLLNSISAWSREAGLNPPPSLKSDRAPEKDKDFQRLTVHATATGSMAQIGRFLWCIQTSNVPVRVTELQFASRKDGVDDLKVDMDIATIYFSPPPPQNDNGSSSSSGTSSASDSWEAQ